MASDRGDDALLRSVALRNARSIHAARQQAEEEMLRAKKALEQRSEELARSLAMMSATLEATTDAIVVTDLDGQVTAYNENYARIWRLPPDLPIAGAHLRLVELNSRKFADPARFLERVEEIYRSDDNEIFDLLELTDGRVLERFSRIQYLDGRNVGRVWSFRDITARRRAEDELRNEARVLEVLNRTGRLIASSLELPAVLQAVTDAATDITGAAFGAFFYNATDENGDLFQLYALSGAPKELFGPFGHPRATSLFGPTFRGEAPIRCDDVRKDPRYGNSPPHFGIPKGHLPVCSYLAVAVVSRTGEPIGGLVFGHPEPGVFTERAERIVVGIAAQASVAIDNARLYEDARRLASERERLIEAERELRSDVERVSRIKDEFLATLSHELRTPLTAILGWANVLLRSSDPQSLDKGLQAIQRNARAQAQLIEDLLDMSGIVSGKVRLEVQPTDVAAVIHAAVDAVRPSAETKEIRLSVDIAPRTPAVSGDATRLQQVVWNLLTNAIKFTPKRGRVGVALACVGSQVTITVSDSGMGISPDFLPQVFDRFRQADSSTTRRYGGLGLGLSIVKQLVELHGGGVRAESRGEDQGATFVVTLPVASNQPIERREPQPFATPPVREFSESYLEGLRVLVVDDESDTRHLLEHLLAEHGAAVTIAGTAAEGLAVLQRIGADIVISDIGMPGTDGYQFMREVRSLPASRGGKTPAIALTAFARSEDRARAVVAGYQMHISKPVDSFELIAGVGSLAGRSASSATEAAKTAFDV